MTLPWLLLSPLVWLSVVQVTIKKRRDENFNEEASFDTAVDRIEGLLDEVQSEMFEQALAERDEKYKTVSTMVGWWFKRYWYLRNVPHGIARSRSNFACFICWSCRWFELTFVFRWLSGSTSTSTLMKVVWCWYPSATQSRLKNGSKKTAKEWREMAKVLVPKVCASPLNSQSYLLEPCVSRVKGLQRYGVCLAAVINHLRKAHILIATNSSACIHKPTHLGQ